MRKILVLGGTGALGVYLVKELLEMGDAVDVVAKEPPVYSYPNLRYFCENAMDNEVLQARLTEGYDAVIDYMVYSDTDFFRSRYELFLKNTKHYIFLSTYRIYAGEHPITEESPRLKEVTSDEVLLSSNDYCIYKAEQEDILRSSPYSNYTIIRPSITYSKTRFQLTTLEANVIVTRMRQGKTVVLPEAAMDVQGTMTWSGDSAKMVKALILNPKAFRETYTISTAEHHTWREIAEMYREIGGLKYVTVDTETFVDLLTTQNKDPMNRARIRQQLVYDRCFDRIVDNTKILEISGLRQSDLMPLRQGLQMEYEALPKDFAFAPVPFNDAMDAYLKEHGLE